MESIDKLATFSKHSKLVNIVIEASKGSGIKLKYDAENSFFRAEKVLPLGLVFPFDFGFFRPIDAKSHEPMQPMVTFDSRLKVAIGEFFVKYNELQGKEFTVLSMEGSKNALAIIEHSIQTQPESNGDRVKKHVGQRTRHAANA